LWAALIVLLLRALVLAVRGRRLGQLSLLLAAFAGVVLSVPFLPPMDGGARFYASTMAFFFALPAIAVAGRRAFIEAELESDRRPQLPTGRIRRRRAAGIHPHRSHTDLNALLDLFSCRLPPVLPGSSLS
jgi:hypothetical protein